MWMFCYAATQSEDGEHIPTVRRASIHGIHAFFSPTSVTHHTDGKEPISAKKLAVGDENFDTKKEMIGFIFDGVKRTVPPRQPRTSKRHIPCSDGGRYR